MGHKGGHWWVHEEYASIEHKRILQQGLFMQIDSIFVFTLSHHLILQKDMHDCKLPNSKYQNIQIIIIMEFTTLSCDRIGS